MRQFCAELWRTTAGRVEALPVGGSDSMHAVWEIARGYNGGWKEAEGLAHVMKLELDRAGAVSYLSSTNLNWYPRYC